MTHAMQFAEVRVTMMLSSPLHLPARAVSLCALVALGLACAAWDLPESALTLVFLILSWVAWREAARSLLWIVPMATLFALAMHLWIYSSGSWLSFNIELLVGLLGMVASTLLLERARIGERRLSSALQALELGSTDLTRALTPRDVAHCVIEALRKLDLAPHVAFVRWIDGRYQVIEGLGDFAALEGHALPSPHLSEVSSLKDSWNAGHFVWSMEQADFWQVAAVPVTEEEYRPLGTLLLARPLGQTYRPHERALIQAVARLSGARIAQQQALDSLKSAYENTLLTLGLALEFRDYETEGHTQRVTELSTALVAHLGLSQKQLSLMRQGAYLHDIGKLTVSDGVLLKQGGLDPDERLKIQRHAEVGHRMLEGLPFLERAVREVVRHHHEKWDGSGYPDRLEGEQIPLLARVFAVVDVYDALTSHRPYKRAWSHEEALEELRTQAGVHFDPELVRAFEELMALRTPKLEAQDAHTLH